MKIWILLGAAGDDPDVYAPKVVKPGVTAEWQVSDALDGRSYSEDTIKPLAVMGILDHIREHRMTPGETAEVVFPNEGELDFFMDAIAMQLRGEEIDKPVDAATWIDNPDGVKFEVFPDAAPDAAPGHFVRAFVQAIRHGASLVQSAETAPAADDVEMRP